MGRRGGRNVSDSKKEGLRTADCVLEIVKEEHRKRPVDRKQPKISKRSKPLGRAE